MCKEEQHLITYIMLGDLVPHGGYQFVYGWYLRHAIRAGMLLRLMGWTEGLDCQCGTSTHFSYQVSEVPPSAPPATPNLPGLPSSVNGDWVSWNMEAWKRVSISISYSWQIVFFSTQRPWTTSPQFLSVTLLAAEDLVLYYISCVKMGQVHVQCKYRACRCMTGPCACEKTVTVSVIIPPRPKMGL